MRFTLEADDGSQKCAPRDRVHSINGMHHGQAILEIVDAEQQPNHLERRPPTREARLLTPHLARPNSSTAFA